MMEYLPYHDVEQSVNDTLEITTQHASLFQFVELNTNTVLSRCVYLRWLNLNKLMLPFDITPTGLGTSTQRLVRVLFKSFTNNHNTYYNPDNHQQHDNRIANHLPSD